MAATFNSPPGWPQPPEGWTPPPGWAPDPSWPPAPEGWQFWVDDAAPAAPAQQPPAADPFATQTMGSQPTQVMPNAGPPAPQGAPGAGSGPGLYSYAPSAGLEQPGASPYGGPGQAGPGGPGGPGMPGPGGQPGYPGGPQPKQRNTAAIVVVCVIAALVLALGAWGISSLLGGGGDEPDPTVAPTTAEPTDEPTDDPTTDEPTDDATDDTTDPPAGGVVELTGDQPAVAVGADGDPIAELRLAEVVADWQPGADSMFCSEAENGQYLALRFDITTLPALAQEDPPTYTLIGWEIGAEVDGAKLEANRFGAGIFCLDEGQTPPSEMQPDKEYEGWVLLDVPTSVTAVTYDNIFDFTGESQSYRWVLADQ